MSRERATKAPEAATGVSGPVGIYGGTFDPIHVGHLILARDAVEQLGLSRLIFVPAAISPHKLTAGPGASAEARWAMVQAAINGEPAFCADDCELRREGPSYAFDTVTLLRQALPAATPLYYLIGEDNVRALHTWHRIEELRDLVHFVVFRRRHGGEAPWEMGFPVVDRVIDISATDIRMRVAGGRSIRYLVPEAVAEIVDARRLYRGVIPSPPKN